MLIVLDNVGPVEQVRPLLPGSPGCAVVVTSRDSLAGLVVRDGASRLDLDLLPLQDAIGLLQELTGRRTDEDPEAAAILAERCCPAAAGAAGRRRAGRRRPTVPLAELAAELTNQQTRLDMLTSAETGIPRCARCSPGPTGTWASRRPRLPAARPAPGYRLRRLLSRRNHRHEPRPGPPGAGDSGPRPPGAACRAGQVRHARLAARLRPGTC